MPGVSLNKEARKPNIRQVNAVQQSGRRLALRDQQERYAGFRGVAGCVGGEDFDNVSAELAVESDGTAGPEADILKDAVEKNVVTDVDLRVEVIRGLLPVLLPAINLL
jgi:hypothetical protein